MITIEDFFSFLSILISLFSSYDPDQFIQTQNTDNNNTIENEKHINLNITKQNQENSVVNINKDKLISSEIKDEIQYSKDNIVNEIPTTIIKVGLLGEENAYKYPFIIFLSIYCF